MRSEKKLRHKRDLLVGVVKRKSDLKLLLERKSYRAPYSKINPEGIKYIAFYFPARVFKEGKCISFYGKVGSFKIVKRRYLPNLKLSNAKESADYVNFYFTRFYNLKNTVINDSHMRITFKRTEYVILHSSKTLSQLYDVKPLEDIMNDILLKWGKSFKREYTVKTEGGKFRLDFAFICRDGILGIECDSKKWHTMKKQSDHDMKRDSLLEKANVRVIHFKENEVVGPEREISKRIEESIIMLGGIIS